MWWIEAMAVLGVAAVLALVAAVLRRSERRARTRWLTAHGLALDAASFEQRAREFRCVVAIDFGFGREFWVTHREEPEVLGEAMGQVIADGYYILCRASFPEMEIRCQRLGLPFSGMMSVDHRGS